MPVTDNLVETEEAGWFHARERLICAIGDPENITRAEHLDIGPGSEEMYEMNGLYRHAFPITIIDEII